MDGEGGAPEAGGAAGAVAMGGAGGEQGSAGGAGGEGGGGDVTDFITPCTECASDLGDCSTELDACLADDTCGGQGEDLGEFQCMLECIQLIRRDDDADFIATSEMPDCADICAGPGGGWSQGLDATTTDLFDCLAGGEVVPASPWDAPAADNCTSACFGAGG
jgi:hypothetical protein